MKNWTPGNAVERRLMNAYRDWMDFAGNKQARLLLWQTNDADREIVDLLFQMQTESSSAVMHLVSPFENRDQYAKAITSEIIAFYDERREGSPAQGVIADWIAPKKERDTDTQYVLRMANSLMHHHPDVFPGIILVFSPSIIRNANAFEKWLDVLLSDNQTKPWQSDRIRFVFFQAGTESMSWIKAKWPQHIVAIQRAYHMEAVPRELVAESGERGPSGQFRRLFVELTETFSHDDPVRLERLRYAALQVSEQAKWFDQSVVVHLLAGAAYLKWQNLGAALSAYEDAVSSAHRALEVQHPAGNKLVVNGLFGEASVHLQRNDYRKAARCYEKAAPHAIADKDGILAVEAWRMHAFCLEKIKAHDKSIESGFSGLDAGHLIDAPLRANSNLRLLTEWMLATVGFFHSRRGQLNDRLTSLYGKNWPEDFKEKDAETVGRQLMTDAAKADAS